MEKYAVLETGGKQTLVKVGQRIEIEKIAVEAGQDAELTTVLAVSDGTSLKVGTPYVEGAKVVSPTGNIAKFAKYSSLPKLSQIWMYMPVPVAGIGMIVFELEQVFQRLQEFFVPTNDNGKGAQA